jgi:hyperosmotically inducible periplasmic protein
MITPRVLAATAVLVAMPAFACNRAQTSREAERATEQVKTAAEQAGEKLADSWLTAKIQAQFFVDEDIKSRYINVSSRDGVVKLKGFVESDDARRQVLEITRNTDGVKQIDEQQLLVGRPASESFETASTTFATAPVATTGIAPAAPAAPLDDSTVVSLVQAKYFLDPTIKGRNISVELAGGVVTLRGQVASENERAQALTLARSTPGVQRVEDYLTVDAALQ